jgi:hypothetical protein
MNKSKNANKRDKAGLAKLLRLKEGRDPFEWVWDELVRDYKVEEWERGVTSEEEILAEAKEELASYRRALDGPASSSGQREKQKQEEGVVQDIPVKLTERERDARDALRKHLAAHAAKRPLVQRFRREHPLLQRGLPTEDEEIAVFLYLELGVEPDLEQYLNSHRGKPSNALPFSQQLQFPQHAEPLSGYGPPVTSEGMAQILAKEHAKQERWLEDLWVREPELFLQRIQEEGSEPGGYLEELGKWLVNTYPWLHVGDAVVFVISGRPPRLAEPLSAAMDMGNATYSITFSPWVSEEAVVRAYRATQGFHRRSSGDKTIRVLRFVAEQTDAEGGLPSWDKLLALWNAANPDERFKGRDGLHRAYSRAVEALVPPYLPLGLRW